MSTATWTEIVAARNAREKAGIIRNDFSASASCFVTMSAALAGVKLVDRTVDAGHYDREAFETNQVGWDKIHTVMTAARSVATGTEKRVLTHALGRIITTEKAAKWEAERAARIAARRAARNA